MGQAASNPAKECKASRLATTVKQRLEHEPWANSLELADAAVKTLRVMLTKTLAEPAEPAELTNAAEAQLEIARLGVLLDRVRHGDMGLTLAAARKRLRELNQALLAEKRRGFTSLPPPALDAPPTLEGTNEELGALHEWLEARYQRWLTMLSELQVQIPPCPPGAGADADAGAPRREPSSSPTAADVTPSPSPPVPRPLPRLTAIPRVGFGTRGIPPHATRAAVTQALAQGYRMFDCSPSYGNQSQVGDALSAALASGTVHRDDLIIVTKLPYTSQRRFAVRLAASQAVAQLQCGGFVDLYLLEWPRGHRRKAAEAAARKQARKHAAATAHADDVRAMRSGKLPFAAEPAVRARAARRKAREAAMVTAVREGCDPLPEARRAAALEDRDAEDVADDVEAEAMESLDMAPLWAGMQALVRHGIARAVGVADFTGVELDALQEAARAAAVAAATVTEGVGKNARQVIRGVVPPEPVAVNCVECHVYLQQHALRRHCEGDGADIDEGSGGASGSGDRSGDRSSNHDGNICTGVGVNLLAHSCLGAPAESVRRAWGAVQAPHPLHDAVVASIAGRHGRSPAQVLLRYNLQRGLPVLVSSRSFARAGENVDLFDFALSRSDMLRLRRLDRAHRFRPSPCPGLPTPFPAGEIFDAVVVGASAVGCAVARALAAGGQRVVLLERRGEILSGSSSAAAVPALFSGWHLDRQSRPVAWRAMRRGIKEFLRLHVRFGVPFKQGGSTVCAASRTQRANLFQLLARAKVNGHKDAFLLTERELRRFEPMLDAATMLHGEDEDEDEDEGGEEKGDAQKKSGATAKKGNDAAQAQAQAPALALAPGVDMAPGVQANAQQPRMQRRGSARLPVTEEEEEDPNPGVALHVPKDGVVDPWLSALACVHQACSNGLEVKTGCTVVGGEFRHGLWTLETETEMVGRLNEAQPSVELSQALGLGLRVGGAGAARRRRRGRIRARFAVNCCGNACWAMEQVLLGRARQGNGTSGPPPSQRQQQRSVATESSTSTSTSSVSSSGGGNANRVRVDVVRFRRRSIQDILGDGKGDGRKGNAIAELAQKKRKKKVKRPAGTTETGAVRLQSVYRGWNRRKAEEKRRLLDAAPEPTVEKAPHDIKMAMRKVLYGTQATTTLRSVPRSARSVIKTLLLACPDDDCNVLDGFVAAPSLKGGLVVSTVSSVAATKKKAAATGTGASEAKGDDAAFEAMAAEAASSRRVRTDEGATTATALTSGAEKQVQVPETAAAQQLEAFGTRLLPSLEFSHREVNSVTNDATQPRPTAPSEGGDCALRHYPGSRLVSCHATFHAGISAAFGLAAEATEHYAASLPTAKPLRSEAAAVWPGPIASKADVVRMTSRTLEKPAEVEFGGRVWRRPDDRFR